MVKFRLLSVNLSVSYFFLSTLAVLILIDRTGMLSLSLLAVLIHELGHLCMMKILKVLVDSVDFSLGTVRVTTKEFMDYKKTLCVSAAGPLANLIFSLCIFFNMELIKYFGIANLIMLVFNMVPAKGLDGGDVLYYALLSVIPKSADKIFNIVSYFSIAIIILLGAGLLIATKSNITLFFVGIYLLILSFNKI